MKEGVFLKRNRDKWLEMEKDSQNISKVHPDKLSDLFVELTDDLSHSRTNHPKSPTTTYLNALAIRVHQAIYKNRKERGSRFITFWTEELPLVFYYARKEILMSAIIFFGAALIGVFSCAYDDSFVRLILGDGYVDMTLRNIEKGNPMGVYQDQDEVSMFFMIFFNNIRVSFWVFIWGGIETVYVLGGTSMFPLFALLSVGTAYRLFTNGVMLGSFQYFFYQKNLFIESASVIWLHGVVEIWAIVIAGAAGILIGNSILFPQTYTRYASFLKAAKNGVKIILGMIPFFFLAAFIESFITRYANMPMVLKLLIIFGSLVFVLYYTILLPVICYKKTLLAEDLK